ncbi:hypothetical protein [Bdellovibrio sp. HCB337]|uniref:hypothetical protein n=1 Tax=Bdellovibrio sp. HCB337 TaxID=3394358 RepID=UPI0039A755EF
MDFKNISLTLCLIFTSGLVACGPGLSHDSEDNYNIGNPTKSVASLNTPDEGESQSLVLFDKTVRRIHHFDVTNMKHIRSFGVRNPQDDHFVLYGNNGNYIIDLSLKELTIFDKFDQAQHSPIKFQGTPRSAAFLPSKGLVVIYDDLMSVGMMKLGNTGTVLNKWVGGASVAGFSTISAGDLNADGKLILGLNNGSIVVVNDLEKCMDDKSWGNLDPFITGLGDIKWLAPLPQQPNQILVRTQSQIVLLDIVARTQLASYPYSSGDRVMKLSKFNDPHVIIQSGNKIRVIYAENSQIKERVYIPQTQAHEVYYILSSNLDLAKDSWSFVDSTEPIQYFFNDVNATQKERRFARYRFSDFLSEENEKVANNTQVELGQGFIFSLYPSELGYAVRMDVDSKKKSELKLFNLKYIPAD